MKSLSIWSLLLSGILFGTSVNAVTTHRVAVYSDGSFGWVFDEDGGDYHSHLPTITIKHGDTVRWTFPEGESGSIAIIPSAKYGYGPNSCTTFSAYNEKSTLDFTGPMHRAPAGIFVMGRNRKNRDYLVDTLHDETLTNPGITGVLLRFNWNELLPTWKRNNPNASNDTWDLLDSSYNWERLDYEIERAVRHGKMYSIAIKAGEDGTPDWLFRSDNNNQNLGLNPVLLGDTHIKPGDAVAIQEAIADGDTSQETRDKLCVSQEDAIPFGNPTNDAYKLHYNNMLKALANHIKRKNAWYQALAYIKPSGANLTSHENRLPKNCFPECTNAGDICNTKELAHDGYTPDGLYDFYEQQFNVISNYFPNKDMSYMLIHNGFPQIAGPTNFRGCDQITPPLFGCSEFTVTEPTYPAGAEQTDEILDRGATTHLRSFVIQHNGLNHDKRPNGRVLDHGDRGQITGFQTTNTSTGQTENIVALNGAFERAYRSSRAIFIEAYESILFDTIIAEGVPYAEGFPTVLDNGAKTPRTLVDWNNLFIERRNYGRYPLDPDDYARTAHLPEFRSNVYEYTFNGQDIKNRLQTGPITLHYIDPVRCDTASRNNVGTIIIEPEYFYELKQTL